MVAGGCDYDCHRRRFRTKLITMAMLGYSRVIIEPSGIFDVDEFFDILHEDPLDRRYEIGSVLTIVNADLEENFTPGTDYMLASQCSQAGRLVLSHVQEVDEERIRRTIDHINRALASIRCERTFSLKENVTALDWDLMTGEDLRVISGAGYEETSFEKNFSMDENSFSSMFFMNISIPTDQVLANIERLWKDTEAGNVIRVKGFLAGDPGKNTWIEVNSTRKGTRIEKIREGQEILIVIGENLKEEVIDAYFPAKYSTTHVR